MEFRFVSRFLLRAPLLPVRALDDAARFLQRHPLGRAAIELASPDLAAAIARARGAQTDLALDRFARRAAFRPTPAGLLAGVAVGRLAPRTRICTTGGQASLAPSWSAMAALGRALLESPAVRSQVRVRVAPSLLAWGGEALWFDAGPSGSGVDSAVIDDHLAAVLVAAQQWIDWPALRARAAADLDERPEHQQAVRADDADADDADQLLLLMIDRGLLHHDMEPPLIGAPALEWMERRLARISPEGGAASELASVRAALQQARVADEVQTLRSILKRLPGGGGAPDINAVLSLEAKGAATLSSTAVERAAALAPLLFRLQEAMSPPVSERVLDATMLERLDGIAEVLGAGALSTPALAAGGYGVRLAETAEPEPQGNADSRLLSYLAGKLADSAWHGEGQIELHASELDELLPAMGVPATFELFLAPAREPARAPAGTGWMLGLHAPAGASLGRFAAALGEPLMDALRELTALEAQARPGERIVDVAYSPSPALADLCAHPQLRSRALALSGWPERDAVTPGQLELVVDPALAESPALRFAADGEPLEPSPLHRVRSTTAPPGLLRLLAGWSFARQHAPWAFGWGPLAALEKLPRVVLDGFVLAPASWRIPSRERLLGRGGLARWRREQGVPEAVQVGQGDELLFIDLRARGAAAELAKLSGGRAWEIWPPLDRLVDAGGRRVEAVVAVATVPEAEEVEALASTLTCVRDAGRVPPPADAPPASGWTTHRVYCVEQHHPAVLLEAVAPAVAAARDAAEIDRWFFLPYVEPATGREHLRVRVHAATRRGGEAFARRLRHLLSPLQACGAVVTVEQAEYFRESARYGGQTVMPAVEQLFEASSELALRMVALTGEMAEMGEATPVEPVPLLVRGADALTRGLGLAIDARRALALELASAIEPPSLPELRREHRRHAKRLAEWLSGAATDVLSPALDALARVAGGLPAEVRQRMHPALPALLHVQAVRLAGPHPEDELAAYYMWERTLAGLQARSSRDT